VKDVHAKTVEQRKKYDLEGKQIKMDYLNGILVAMRKVEVPNGSAAVITVFLTKMVMVSLVEVENKGYRGRIES
jgi:hypothetical protein